jgi:hypothetical protein
MVQVEADPAKNLLKIAFSNKVTAVEVRDNLAKVEGLLKTLKPGFRLLTDLSGLESMELGSASHIERSMDLMSKTGISKVVRVIPDPSKDIGLKIMSLFHYSRKVQIVTCESREEAARALE